MSARGRTLLLVPAVLLAVAVLEDMITFKVRQHVRDVHLRVAIILVLNGAAFGVAADWVTPHIKRLLTSVHRGSRREAGGLGLFVFYVMTYAGLYYAYFVSETRGVGALFSFG